MRTDPRCAVHSMSCLPMPALARFIDREVGDVTAKAKSVTDRAMPPAARHPMPSRAARHWSASRQRVFAVERAAFTRVERTRMSRNCPP